MPPPGPAGQESTVNDQLLGRVKVLHGRDLGLKILGDQWDVGVDNPTDRGLRNLKDLREEFLGEVMAQR